MSDREDQRAALLSIMRAGIAAAHPDAVVPPWVDRLFPAAPPSGRTMVIGAGKAAAHMAAAFEAAYPWPIEGFVVTRRGFAVPTRRIEVVEGGHPIPDEEGAAAAARMLALVATAHPGDRVVFLLSGGASSLLPAPVSGVALEEKRAITAALLRSGAPIADVNRLRAGISEIKGGELQRHCPAPITTLAISDVVGDDPAAIGSGPTWPVDVGKDHLLQLARRWLPDRADALACVLRDRPRASPAGSAPDYHLMAGSADMLAAAAGEAERLGFHAVVHDPDAEGEAVAVAQAHSEAVRVRSLDGRPTAHLSGGELTVTMGDGPTGRGGPNQEYALAFTAAADERLAFTGLAIDSDGVDGVGDAAGAFHDELLPAAAREAGLDPAKALAMHDAGTLLERLGYLLRPGPTGTNVNDLRVTLTVGSGLAT